MARVERRVGASCPGHGPPRFAARRSEHAGLPQLGDLDRGEAHATGGAMHEDVLSSAGSAPLYERVPSRGEGDGYRRAALDSRPAAQGRNATRGR